MRFLGWTMLASLSAALLSGQSDLFEWTLRLSLDAGQSVTAIAFSPDGAEGAIGTLDGSADVFDPAARQPSFRPLARHEKRVVALQFTSDGSALMSAGEDGQVLVSPIGGSTGVRTIRAKAKLFAAALSRDGALLATASEDKTVAVWDIQSGRQLAQLQHKSKKPFLALGFANKDTLLVGISGSGMICKWDVKTRAVVSQQQDSDQVAQSAWVGAGLLLLGAESAAFQKGPLDQLGPIRANEVRREDRVKIYDLDRLAVAKTLDGIDGGVVALSGSPDGRFIGVLRRRVKDSFLDVYDSRRGVPVASSSLLRGNGTSVAFSELGQWLGLATDRGDVSVWQIKGIAGQITPDQLRGVVYTITSENRNPLVAPDQPQTVAVMDFIANSVDRETGPAVADMIRTRISEGKNVRVVERAQMDQIIKEQNFQRSDRVDASTAVKLGQMLGAAKMIFGSVSREDTRFTVNVRMVDVRTGVVDGVREITCEPCSTEGLQEAVIRLKEVLVR